MAKYNVFDCTMVELDKHHSDRKGNLTVVENGETLPFDVIVDDGKEKKTFHLNRSYYGLYIPKGMWREMDNFSTNSLALEFASTNYNPEDYIRDYNEFLKLKEDGEI